MSGGGGEKKRMENMYCECEMTTMSALNAERQHNTAVSVIKAEVVITTKTEQKQNMARNSC